VVEIDGGRPMVVSPFSAWRLMVRAALCGSLPAVKVKTGSWHPGEASCIGGQAQEAVIECGVGEDEGRRRQLGVAFLGRRWGL
jgi:hypothetical protein